MIGRRERRPGETAYAVFQTLDGIWTWHVLKSWQLDPTKPYARWLCWVVTPMTGRAGDLGDTYVYDILVKAEALLIEVDGEKPTGEELDQVTNWRLNCAPPEERNEPAWRRS